MCVSRREQKLILPVIPGGVEVPSQDLHALVSVWYGLLQFLDGNLLIDLDEFCIEKVENLRKVVEEQRPQTLTANIIICLLLYFLV